MWPAILLSTKFCCRLRSGCFLAVILSEACFYFLALTLYPFCHHHLCPDLSFNLPIVSGFFWLATLFLQVSSLITKIKDLRRNPELPLPALLAKKFSCCVSYCFVSQGSVCIHLRKNVTHKKFHDDTLNGF